MHSAHDSHNEFFQSLNLPDGRAIVPVGSRTILGAATPNSDYDYLVWLHGSCILSSCFSRLLKLSCTYSNVKSPFIVYETVVDNKKVNLIVTQDQEAFNAFYNANKLAVRLNLVDKSERLALFQAILYGNYPIENSIFFDSETLVEEWL